MFAQVHLSWDELARQMPFLAVAMLIAWYCFRHLSRQHAEHLKDVREQGEKAFRVATDASARVESAKDALVKQLQDTVAAERSEKDRLLKTIEKIGEKL